MMIQTSELKKLEEVYGQSGNQIVLLYGRDNCQKEQLIKEFCKEKKFFYYRARQASEREQVLQMGQEVEAKYGIRLIVMMNSLTASRVETRPSLWLLLMNSSILPEKMSAL